MRTFKQFVENQHGFTSPMGMTNLASALSNLGYSQDHADGGQSMIFKNKITNTEIEVSYEHGHGHDVIRWYITKNNIMVAQGSGENNLMQQLTTLNAG